MRYSKLEEYVNAQDWELAREELDGLENQEFDDVISILACAVCFYEGNLEAAYDYICRGLFYNPKNYELYLLLGNYYEVKNINQAWLCYENAEFYCDNPEDLQIIRQYKANVEAMEGWCIRPTSIVILSYNLKEVCQGCIESIRANNLPSSYELIVVDNASSDGIVDWLREQKDIKLICNEENRGFPYGCNQGIKIAEPDNDILLLNNDTIVTMNALFWLRMGLYEEACIGATGSISNYAGNNQLVEERFSSLEEWVAYGTRNNLPGRNVYEKKLFLIGFAMLLKREALDKVGLLDVCFSPGSYEDDDIGIRLQYAGYKLLLCHNSFIFHYGSGGGANRKLWNPMEVRNHQKFKEKWGFDIQYYTWARRDLIQMIDRAPDEEFRLLEVGCGCGATLSRIEYLWPNAQVSGIELVEQVACLGAHYLDVMQGNIETMELPYEKGTFDYIVFGDVLEHLYNPTEVLKRMTSYLKKDGGFLCSVPNLMHESVILPLLKGRFEYGEAGILDNTHIRFFTLESIVRMLDDCGFKVDKIATTSEYVERTSEDAELLEAFYRLPHIADRSLFEVYQYVFLAKRNPTETSDNLRKCC